MARKPPKGNGGGKRYFPVHHHMMDCEAWRSLSPAARSVMLEVMFRYTSFNNGQIGLGEREAGEAINQDRRIARKAFRELTEKGFLRVTKKGAFAVKDKQASEWEVTCYALPGDHTPKAWFLKWKPGTVIDWTLDPENKVVMVIRPCEACREGA